MATVLVQPQQRVALIIGNGAFVGSLQPSNPVKDAKAISAKLSDIGFNVTTLINGLLCGRLIAFNLSRGF